MWTRACEPLRFFGGVRQFGVAPLNSKLRAKHPISDMKEIHKK
jgi:hypothetical protein